MENKQFGLDQHYPKVLIIGRPFVKGPGDPTLTNLFKGWDKQHLAVAAVEINNPDFDMCSNYYELGALENKRNFPYNIIEFKRRRLSGPLLKENQKDYFDVHQVKVTKPKRIYHSFSDFFGLSHYRKRFKLSKPFLNWIEDFSPDYIYAQLSFYEYILFVSELHKKLKIPTAIHIMDDWPSTVVKKGIFKSFWQKVIDKKFRELLDSSKVLMSISEAMSTEYKIRYGHNFVPFHNPVDTNFWEVPNPKLKNDQNPFVILYAGRIGRGIRTCFYDIAAAIKTLVGEGLAIELHIQVVNYNPVLDDLEKYDFVKLNNPIHYSELPKLFANTDLLLIPNDFDAESVSYLKYSMPTKASEYMVSGTPILVYSDIKSAITQHALKYNWAFVVSEQDNKKLVKCIREIYNNQDMRNKIGTSAKEFAKKHFDSNIVRNEFRKAFL